MPTPPGFADVSIKFQQTGLTRAAYITFGVDTSDPDPATTASNVINAINGAGSLKTIIDTTVTISGVRVSLGTDGAADLALEVPTTIAGTNNLTGLPPNCAVLVHKGTARGGRRGRGRLFIPWCVTNSAVAETGIVNSTQLGTIQTAMTAFLAALTTFSVPMVLLHNPGLTIAPAPDPVTSLTAVSLISTQRRRLGR
jgi:hypothetical protein